MSLEVIVKSLSELAKDEKIPKNVRECLIRSKECLESKESLSSKISSAIYSLDEIATLPNVPAWVRTEVWNLVSKLEELAKEVKG